jgi:hypothetical protein
MGFIDRPFADTTVAASTPAWTVVQTSVRDCHIPNMFRSCRSSRLQRFSPQRANPKTRPFDCLRVCCTPQPAMGFTTFRTPWSGLSTEPDPEVVDPKVRGSLPLWRIPFEAFPSSTAFDHAVTARRPFGLGRVHRLACPPAVSSRARCRVATLRCSARRPQGFLPSRSPLRSRDVAVARPLDAPLGFGSTRSRCCHAFRVAQSCAGRFALRPNRFGVPDPNVEGRQDVSALSGSVRPKVRPSPKGGPRTVAVAPEPPEGGTSAASLLGPEGIGGMPVDPPGGSSTASVRRPKARGCQRDRDASPKRLVRDPALAPKSGAGGSSSFSPSFGGRPRT